MSKAYLEPSEVEKLESAAKYVRDKLQARSRTHAAIIAAQAGIVGNPINGIAQGQSNQS